MCSMDLAENVSWVNQVSKTNKMNMQCKLKVSLDHIQTANSEEPGGN